MSTGWREPSPPDAPHVTGVTYMPCGDPSARPPTPRPRKPRPGCADCTPDGACRRHSYALTRSVAGTPRPGDLDVMRGTWVNAL